MAKLGELNGACPLPVSSYDRIVLGHGGGGLLSTSWSSGYSCPLTVTRYSPHLKTRRQSGCPASAESTHLGSP